MLRVMKATVADEAKNHSWLYRAIRPLRVVIWHLGLKVVSDCSTGARIVSRTADGPDPMGLHYAPYGNSATACAHLDHYDHVRELQVGDYVTFGILGHEHMAVVQALGPDPLLWSDGHQGAPNNYRLSQDGRPYQLLRNPVEVVPETPKEKLRAKTGYWSWLQWYLGEGAWRHYGKRAKDVRPDVPRWVPLGWWKRLAHLMWLRRKKRANVPTTAAIPSA